MSFNNQDRIRQDADDCRIPSLIYGAKIGLLTGNR